MDETIMVDYEKLGSEIKRQRHFHKLTQENLSELTGISPTHISNIETGHSKVSLIGLVRISNALECTLDDLLFGTTINADNISIIDFKRKFQTLSAREKRILVDITDATIKSLKKNIS